MPETVATTSLRTSRGGDASPGADRSRHFFTGLGAWCIVLALLGFGPHVGGSLRGAIVIPPAVHVHAAVMMAWLVLYGGQAWLAARGNLGRHRRVGWAAMVLALAVWVSMGVATVVALRRFDPDAFAFLVKPLLIQLGTMVVFPIFVGWAVLVRRRTGWHQRLMTFANFSLVQAALDRIGWLPNEGLPMFWHSGLRAYVLLILPLVVFDIVSLRRIHPATLMGAGLIVGMHAVISFYWAHAGWNEVARGFWLWLR